MQRGDDQAFLFVRDGLSAHQRAEVSDEGMHIDLRLLQFLVYLLLVVCYLLLIDLGDELSLLPSDIG